MTAEEQALRNEIYLQASKLNDLLLKALKDGLIVEITTIRNYGDDCGDVDLIEVTVGEKPSKE